MPVSIGDLVHIKVDIHDVILLEGIGVVVKKGESDKASPMADNVWLVFCDNEFWHIDEKHIRRITDRRSSVNIKRESTSSFAKQIRNLAKGYKLR